MEGGYTCGICSRVFPSGKALGGHMRAHFAFHTLPPRSETLSDFNTQIMPNQTKPSSSMERKEEMMGHSIEDNSDKSIPPLTDLVHSSSSEKKSHCKSKGSHQPELIESHISSEKSIDSLSLALSAEDAASILLHMSKGEITRDANGQMDKGKRKLEENNRGNGDDQNFDDDSDSDDENEDAHSSHHDKSQLRVGEEQSIHHGEIACRQAFTSSRNPKERNEISIQLQAQINTTNTTATNERGKKRRKHECSTCSRVFRSGRALSAHRKIHKSLLNSKETKLPDLNLPPPDEDDEEANKIN